MSQPVTLNDDEMRARMRPLGHAARPATYTPRPGAEHSRKLFQDMSVVENFQLPESFSKLANAEPTFSAPVVHSAPTATPQASDIPRRQPLDVVRHKPESSKVLRRESFTASPLIPTETVFVERSFAPPPRAQRIKLPPMPQFFFLRGSRLTHTLLAAPLKQRALVGLAAIVLLVGSGITLAGIRTNHLGKIGAAKASIAAAVPATTTNSTNSRPSTAPITFDTLRSYQVAPEAPRYIRIAKFGVIARVLQVGITKEGALATPSNVFDSAWYKDSALPGTPGATLIDGHVSSWATNGVFHDIKNLVAGDKIEIEKGDRTKLSYKVVQVKKFPKESVDMASLLRPITAGASGLNLITCGGKYDSKSGEFSDRVAVYATLN